MTSSTVHHDVVVVGAGPSGLVAASRLARAGFEVVVLERAPAVAARWRSRYEPLRLNTLRSLSHLPGQRIPRRAGRYPSRDDFITYLEDYAVRHRLAVRFGTAVERIDRAVDGWRLDTSTGPLLARYVVVATGWDAVPVMPEWPGRDDYAGDLLHSADFFCPDGYRGREVLIVGAGNSGVDIAGHLVRAGAKVTVSMRTPPTIVPRMRLGVPAQVLALIADHLPSKVGDTVGALLQRITFGDLRRYGLPRAPVGFQTMFRRCQRIAAVDDGFVAALKAGDIRLVSPIERFDGGDVVLNEGTRLQPDTVIAATGYRRGLETMVGHLGVLRPDGIPIHHDGAPEHPSAPRLYFCGFWTSNGGQIRLMPGQARRIAWAAARDRGGMSRRSRPASDASATNRAVPV